MQTLYRSRSLGCSALNTFMKKIVRMIGKLWKAVGEPLPGTARFLRHTLLPAMLRKRTPAYPETAVIIISHNYGSLLPRAIESVLKQTVALREILVIDDASSDNTKDVAALYAEKGVSYMRVEHRNLSLTRNTAAAATVSEFLLFLDADDFLPPNYIERCVEKMKDPAVGFVYANIQQFGDWNTFLEPPEFNPDMLARGNYITSNALLRRQMFDLVGGYTPLPHSFEDWEFLQRCIAMGYRGIKADTWVHYNLHADSLSAVYRSGPHRSYANDAALLQKPLTIFTPFSGRTVVFERYLKGLLSCTVNPQNIHLWWYNTSDDPAFDALLRRTIATLPFGSVRYSHVPLPKNWAHTSTTLQQEDRMNNDTADYYYQLAVLRAYNTMITECQTELVVTLEDDMELKPETLAALLTTMEGDIAAVIAPYRHRVLPRYEVWMPLENGTTTHFSQKGTGLQDVGGCGFGCTLFRTRCLKHLLPLYTGVKQDPKQWYDQIAYLRLQQQGRIVCNWDLEINHLQSLPQPNSF